MPFHDVYKAAIEQNPDITSMDCAVLKLHTINGVPLLLNPLVKLAYKNEHIAIEFWFEKMPRWDKRDIVLGYALAGNTLKDSYLQYTDTIILGYILAGYEKQAKTYYSMQADIDNLIYAFTWAGNHETVEKYCKQSPASLNKIKGLDQIVFYYALADKTAELEKYLKKYSVNKDMIAFAYALRGKHDKVSEYCNQYKIDVNFIAQGYAMAGNHEQVENLRKNYGADVNWIADGYAKAGYLTEVNTYRDKYNATIQPGDIKRCSLELPDPDSTIEELQTPSENIPIMEKTRFFTHHSATFPSSPKSGCTYSGQ